MESLRYYGSLLFNGYTPEWQLAANAAAATEATPEVETTTDASETQE